MSEMIVQRCQRCRRSMEPAETNGESMWLKPKEWEKPFPVRGPVTAGQACFTCLVWCPSEPESEDCAAARQAERAACVAELRAMAKADVGMNGHDDRIRFDALNGAADAIEKGPTK